ncbi:MULTISPECIES: ABC transporter ATP-binding protein [Candidatus Ichthyocystis]|uniref:Branched chain amino acid transporter ATP-binding subunit n=1 Tax=Candidatus Ichthyocystis hellenicum TaxID=1561003 RepID=A0A0S4M165_9BURK|nr:MULTISPECIES: ABC transporter ATP-binding protein [Ichthyocystis]CUT17513.1 branched chain amino acid transporter ATP-binding subunit [Candidatus Ichthyocystis hellenicum]
MSHNVILEAKNICKSFGTMNVLSRVSFVINKEEIFGIIGPNGAGKTTLFNCLTGFGEHTGGNFFLSGKKLRNNDPEHTVSQGIARTFQNIRLFKKLTVLENILVGFHRTLTQLSLVKCFFGYGQKSVIDKCYDLMSYVGIKLDKSSLLADSLSYGDQRKLEIARALATQPVIIALDEPAAGVNSVERETLISLVKKIRNDGTTVLIIEHDIDLVVNLCDRIAVLNFGKKIIDDIPQKVITNSDFISVYLGNDYDDTQK